MFEKFDKELEKIFELTNEKKNGLIITGFIRLMFMSDY